ANEREYARSSKSSRASRLLIRELVYTLGVEPAREHHARLCWQAPKPGARRAAHILRERFYTLTSPSTKKSKAYADSRRKWKNTRYGISSGEAVLKRWEH